LTSHKLTHFLVRWVTISPIMKKTSLRTPVTWIRQGAETLRNALFLYRRRNRSVFGLLGIIFLVSPVQEAMIAEHSTVQCVTMSAPPQEAATMR
jgi:hypothetical protein